MSGWRGPSLRAIVFAGAIVAVVAAVGGFLFITSGLYSVAASRGHWLTTTLLLEYGGIL